MDAYIQPVAWRCRTGFGDWRFTTVKPNLEIYGFWEPVYAAPPVAKIIPVHVDATGATREPPHCPTCSCGISSEPSTCTEKDAARYEWLRENWPTVSHIEPTGDTHAVTMIWPHRDHPDAVFNLDPQTLDHAIDAVMRAENKE